MAQVANAAPILRAPGVKPATSKTAMMRLAGLLSCLALLAASAVASSASHVDVHRRRTCVFATLWDVRFTDITSVSTLESELQWTRIERENCTTPSDLDTQQETEPCWKKENVQIADGKLVLNAGKRTGSGHEREAAKVRAEKSVDGGWSGVNHVQVLAKFPGVCA